jgi:glycosyltransferase involved in cell wall biosynthesis
MDGKKTVYLYQPHHSTQVKNKKIIFDCERMKYPHTGLYHFCLQLGKAIENNKDDKEELTFYVREKEHGAFGNNAHYLNQHSLHKFWMPVLSDYNIWHSTYQGTQYMPTRSNIKVVLTIHDLNFIHEGKSQDKIKRELKKLQKKIDRADHIVAISKFTLQDIEKHLDLKGKPATVIYNGCNFVSIPDLKEPEVNPNRKFIYTIGTITDKKNFHVLPALLVNNDYQLVVSGIVQSEEYFNKIVAQAELHGVSDRVLFTGAVSENDKQWFMKNCEAFVFPSLAEGFGLPVIEAMHFGKPVLLSSLTALPEIGGDAAYYFDSFEPEAMQACFSNSLEHFRKFGEPEKVKQRAAFFNWDNAAKEYLEIYRQL